MTGHQEAPLQLNKCMVKRATTVALTISSYIQKVNRGNF